MYITSPGVTFFIGCCLAWRVSTKSIIGANPKSALTVFENAIDDVAWQSVVSGEPMPNRATLGVDVEQSLLRASPQRAVAAVVEGVYMAVSQASGDAAHVDLSQAVARSWRIGGQSVLAACPQQALVIDHRPNELRLMSVLNNSDVSNIPCRLVVGLKTVKRTKEQPTWIISGKYGINTIVIGNVVMAPVNDNVASRRI